jgi:antitoxin VapB
MQRKARLFMNNRSQAVRLPKEFQFKTQEVFIRKEGGDVILSPRPLDWSSYLTEGPVASSSFMEEIEDLRFRSENCNASLHAGHRHLLLHHEALE